MMLQVASSDFFLPPVSQLVLTFVINQTSDEVADFMVV